MTDKEYYDGVREAMLSENRRQYSDLVIDRANDFVQRMVISNFKNADRIPLLMAVKLLERAYSSRSTDEEKNLAEMFVDCSKQRIIEVKYPGGKK